MLTTVATLLPSGQDSCTLPSRVVNQRARFGSSCLLTELASISDLNNTLNLRDTSHNKSGFPEKMQKELIIHVYQSSVPFWY